MHEGKGRTAMADDSIISAPADAAEATPSTPDGGSKGDGHDKPKPWFKRLSLTTWIFIALILGVLAGMALQGAPEIADTYIKPFGTIFLNLIKMIVVPLVLFSIIAGVVSLDDVKKVGAHRRQNGAVLPGHHGLCRHAGPYLRERDERGRGLHHALGRAFL